MNKQAQIGLRIKAARQEAGLTQEELGAKTGYSAMGISYWEKGLRDIKIKNIEKASQVLGKDINYFLEPLTESQIIEPSGSATYRRGREDLTEEEKKKEKDKIKSFIDKVKSMSNKK